MKIIPLWKVAKNKGDRLWWVRCLGFGQDESNFKMTIPFGMTICTSTGEGWEGITIVKFYFLCFCVGFGYKRAESI